MSCNVSTPDKNYRIDKIEEMWNYFRSKNSVKERFSDPHFGFDPNTASDSLKYLMEQRLNLPFNSDVPFKESHYRRMKVEIDDFANALKGKFSNLAFIAPEGTSKPTEKLTSPPEDIDIASVSLAEPMLPPSATIKLEPLT